MAHECARGFDSCRRIIPPRIEGMVARIAALESDIAFLCGSARKDGLAWKEYELKKAVQSMRYNRDHFNQDCDQAQDKACRKEFIRKKPEARALAIRAYRLAYPNDVTVDFMRPIGAVAKQLQQIVDKAREAIGK